MLILNYCLTLDEEYFSRKRAEYGLQASGLQF